MTVPIPINVKCAVCGKISEQFVLSSTIYLGSSDLDTRPPELARSSMELWLQVCPHCGYVAPNISKHIRGAKKVVKSEQYQKLVSTLDLSNYERERPRLEVKFLCYSLIQENAKNYVEAGWAQVKAAWACDDQGADELAKDHRLKAVEFFNKAKEMGYKFADDRVTEHIILTDVLRRAGKFKSALGTLRDGLSMNPDGLALKILKFEKALIEREDSATHTVEEADNTALDLD